LEFGGKRRNREKGVCPQNTHRPWDVVPAVIASITHPFDHEFVAISGDKGADGGGSNG
jgi:hypothetical protein